MAQLQLVQAMDELIIAKRQEDEKKRQSGSKRVHTDWFEKLERVLKCNTKDAYKRISRIGEGTYSKVFLVKHKGTSKRYNTNFHRDW